MGTLKKYWRQFAVWATGSEDEVFQKAHLKLTLYYIVLIMMVACLCSMLLYFSLKKNIMQDFSAEGKETQIAMTERAVKSLQKNIVSVDITVLVLGSVFSYILARGTLRPVKDWLEMQKEFSANASHELRTPLAIMKTDSEVMLRGGKNSAQDFRLLALRNMEEIDRMSKIVEELLALSREKNTKKAAARKINLCAVVRKLVYKMRKPALAKNIEITFGGLEDGFFYGYLSAIEQAVLNIVQNSIDYTSQGGKVTVGVKNGRKHLLFTVADNGVGIEKDKLPHIFEKFYKADNSESGRQEGCGLGLAIVKEIVDRHQGKIKVTSKVGKGTCVTVWLPKAVD